MDSFEFENGEILKDAVVEYMAVGTPKYDGEGNIVNAIVYCHGSLGNFSSIKKIFPISNKGDVFDLDKYFFIYILYFGIPAA